VCASLSTCFEEVVAADAMRPAAVGFDVARGAVASTDTAKMAVSVPLVAVITYTLGVSDGTLNEAVARPAASVNTGAGNASDPNWKSIGEAGANPTTWIVILSPTTSWLSAGTAAPEARLSVMEGATAAADAPAVDPAKTAIAAMTSRNANREGVERGSSDTAIPQVWLGFLPPH